MNYTAEHLDVEKLEDALDHYRVFQQQELRLAQEKAQSFYAGYEKAISEIRSMFHCCNYESKEKQTKAFLDGFNSAIYEICKELDVCSQEIRDAQISTDEKAFMVAEKIKKVFSESTE